MVSAACVVLEGKSEEHLDVQAQRAATLEGGQTQCVTILMTVGDSTEVGRTTAAEDGATEDGATVGDLPGFPSGSMPVVAVDTGAVLIAAGVNLEPIDNIGDTTEDTDEDLPAREIGGQPPHLAFAAGDNCPALDVEARLPVEQPRDFDLQPAVAELPRIRDVDLGEGIIVGYLSRGDFNEILAFPVCSDS